MSHMFGKDKQQIDRKAYIYWEEALVLCVMSQLTIYEGFQKLQASGGNQKWTLSFLGSLLTDKRHFCRKTGSFKTMNNHL